MDIYSIPSTTWLIILAIVAILILTIAAINKSKKGHIKTEINKKTE